MRVNKPYVAYKSVQLYYYKNTKKNFKKKFKKDRKSGLGEYEIALIFRTNFVYLTL